MEVLMTVFPGKPGVMGTLEVDAGACVKKDATLCNVETGKGNRIIKAPCDGIITKVLKQAGDMVKSKELLFVIEAIVTNELKTDELDNDILEQEKMTTDLLIIGAGPGGYVAAIYAAQNGLTVTLVEKEELGGTCLNVGCIPTKTFVESAKIAHQIKSASIFGLVVDDLIVEMDKIVDRKDNICGVLRDGIDYLMKKHHIKVIKGTASFKDNQTVCVLSKQRYVIKAKNIIVASGSKVAQVNIPGIDLPFVLNSNTALSLRELPKSITIIGGGVIGMEFACIYHHLGVRVHVIEYMEHLLTMIDEDMATTLYDYLRNLGVEIHLSSKVERISASDDHEAVVTYRTNGQQRMVVSENVLVAIGRTANINDLKLENTEIKTLANEKGIAVDEYMQTNVKHIYAIGDCTNIMQLAHVASHQGISAVNHILGKKEAMDYHAVPNVIFTSLEIASVGKSEADCKKEGIDYQVTRFDFSGNGKALTMNENVGYVKLLKEKDSSILIGAGIIGPDASSLITSLTIAIQNKLTVEAIQQTIFAHPTTGEVIHEAALDFSLGAIHQ